MNALSALPVAPPPLCQFSTQRMFTRRATTDDVAVILRLFIENLWPIAQFPPDLQAVGVGVYNIVQEGRVFVLERAGEIIGCAAYTFLQYWYMAKPQMWDQGLFVIPEYRKTRAAHLLKKSLEDEAEKLDMTLILSANTKNTEANRALAKRHRKIAEVFVVRE